MTTEEGVMNLPPFERIATCAKCGTKGLHSTELHDFWRGPWTTGASGRGVCAVLDEMLRGGSLVTEETFSGHLCRTCECCGYRWPEATVGAEPELPAHGGVWLEQRYLDTNHMAVTRCDPS